MIPVNYEEPEEDLLEESAELSDKTFLLNFENNRIQGNIKELEAVKQSIICMLETERYAYLIHTWQYGASLEQYIGQSYDYVTADIGREIKETLMTDDRIIDVYGFKFEQIGENLKVNFEVNTVYGIVSESVVI